MVQFNIQFLMKYFSFVFVKDKQSHVLFIMLNS